jgi:RNA polymerase sigma factor (sigma-70 family)
MTSLMPELDADTTESRDERLCGLRPAMLRLARRRCRSLDDAEDVVGQAILAALHSAVPDSELEPWLGRVVINLCAQSQRGHYRDLRLLARAAQHAELVDDGLEERVVSRLVALHIAPAANRLPERQREVLELRSEGMSVAAIATELGLSYKTVESLLSRARAALRTAAKPLLGALAPLALLRRRWARGTVAVLAPSAMVALGIALIPSPGVGASGAFTSLRAAATPASHSARMPRITPPVRAVAVHGVAVPGKARVVRAPQPLGPRLRPQAGPVSADLGGAERRHPDEGLVQSVQQCVRDHPDVSRTHLGCRDS